ncbi:hypothetical protein M5362_21060 [Streptomyces sp. Je 1-79]|uniref:hypothetical protein n=1 Tax=Streptomyces sp. Je 1-79 TaxID=2943847 RepID=UPI0021A25CDE|nr:hypothetical protein [Streptomyces sp. Je 1-79]MCT4355630.1 hypothetical protein [Streptomyces sp. Je 1-79]
MATVTINQVNCLETTDGLGADDLYINIDGNRVFGVQQIDTGEEAAVGASKTFGTKAKVSLWEYDSGSEDDLIGSFFAHSSQAGEGEHAVALTGDGSRYDVFYTVD